MLTINKFTTIAESCGFSAGEPQKQGKQRYIEISQYTPAGEDWNETIWFKNVGDIISSIWERIEDWDSDDEAEVWINQRGTRGVPQSIRTLLDDQDWKVSKLKELHLQLTKA